MRLFSDSHHSGLYRSLLLLFKDRLGHDIWFPDSTFCDFANVEYPGIWLSPNLASCGGVPEKYLDVSGQYPNVCSKDEFLSTEWDAVIISRPESAKVMKDLLFWHPNGNKIKRIGQAGNEGQYYDWAMVPNFLSSDYLSYLRAPKEINKIHYMQEVGRQFQVDTFTPLTNDNLHTINTYINCLNSFGDWSWDKDRTWWGSKCPHCEGDAPDGAIASANKIWGAMTVSCPAHRFQDFGINNSKGSITEKVMPEVILNSSLTWAYKTYEGFGHSIAQSASMGRLSIVPRRFLKYRTANRFMIPNLTCFEAEWEYESICEIIRWFTSSLERANVLSEACFKAAKGIFNWELEAFRVKEFISQLI